MGVASLVMSSEFEVPVSEAAKTLGNAGAAGEVASIVRGKVVGADTNPPIACVDDTVHTPSTRLSNPHDPVVAVATKVQLDVLLPDVAVTTTVAPTCNPPTEISGLVSFVKLSVDEIPRSDALTRSGALVAGTPTVVALVALIEVSVPVLLLPVTASRRYCPIMSTVGLNDVEFAPEIAVQPLGRTSVPEIFKSTVDCCEHKSH
jgi:hypothetical protein